MQTRPTYVLPLVWIVACGAQSAPMPPLPPAPPIEREQEPATSSHQAQSTPQSAQSPPCDLRAGASEDFGPSCPRSASGTGTVGLGSAEPDGGVAPVRGSLSKIAIQTEIRRHLDAVRICWEREAAIGGGNDGRAEMVFLIGPDGHVCGLKLRSNDTGLSALPCCLADEIRTWQFPPPDGAGVAVVAYPFVFVTAPTEAPAADP